MPDRGSARQGSAGYKRQRCNVCGLSIVLDARACGKFQCARCETIASIDTNGNDAMTAPEAIDPS